MTALLLAAVPVTVGAGAASAATGARAAGKVRPLNPSASVAKPATATASAARGAASAEQPAVVPNTVATCTGTIQVTNTDNNTVLGFVSKVWNSFGESTITADSTMAVSVSIPGASTVDMTATTPPSATFPLVGLIQGFASTNANLGVGSSNYAYLGGLGTSTGANATPQANANSFTTATGIPEDVESTVWTVGVNSNLTAQWVNTDSSKPATFLAFSQGTLIVIGDGTAFGNTFGSFNDVALNLVPNCGSPTTTSVMSSPNPSLPGQSVTLPPP